MKHPVNDYQKNEQNRVRTTRCCSTIATKPADSYAQLPQLFAGSPAELEPQLRWQRIRDSNPCTGLERAVS
jgi:hypothetical protein